MLINSGCPNTTVFDYAESKSVSTPFGAVVGQEALKEALLVVAADDGLDGLLVSGEKGTAKSTLVRGLAALLPDQRVVADCPYGCPPGDRGRQCADCRDRATYPVTTRSVPLVTLPLGATRERVVGTLSVSDALDGEASFEPGLLARANRGLLYVDEVNLLDDHLVDVLLDAAAAGENRVERDGVSVAHPAAFTLVGTMNPEEGDLRPQLRDRFALSVEVTGERDLGRRVAIIDDDLGSGDREPTGDHGRRLRRARELLPSVDLGDERKREIAELCLDAGVDGHRADIATARAARALAALDSRPTVVDGDVRRAAELALAHRMRSTPFEDAPDAESVVEDHFDDGEEASDDEPGDDPQDEVIDDGAGEPDDGETRDDSNDTGDEGGPDGADADGPGDPSEGGDGGDPANEPPDDAAEPGGGAGGDGSERPPAVDASGDADGDEAESGADDDEEATPLMPGGSRAETEPAAATAPELGTPETQTETETASSGRAAAAPAAGNRGGRVRTEPTDGSDGVDAAASVRAAARRGGDGVGERDLRRSVRAGDGEALVVFAVDASASMRPAMRRSKGVALELLEDAYTKRDSVAVVAFAGDDAEVLLPPTASVTLAARHLKRLPTGDRTPLPAGLRTTADLLSRADPDAAVVVVVSDGRANAADDPTAATRSAADALAATGAEVVCVDAGDGRGLLDSVVEATDGTRVPLDALSPERVERAVSAARR
jgi:magnesium chelatase subunit D